MQKQRTETLGGRSDLERKLGLDAAGKVVNLEVVVNLQAILHTVSRVREWRHSKERTGIQRCSLRAVARPGTGRA